METFRLSLPCSLGPTVITANALRQLELRDVSAALRRHADGDRRDGPPEDSHRNRRALLEGCRVLSVQRDRKGQRFWVITEAGRKKSTVLLPEDYR